jgi:alpha/beta superfamily hydrolase
MKGLLLILTLLVSGVSWAGTPPFEAVVSKAVTLVLQNVSYAHQKVAVANIREYQRRAHTLRFVVFKKVKTQQDRRSVLNVLKYSRSSLLKLLPHNLSGARHFFLSELEEVEKSVMKGDWEEVKLRVLPIVRIVNNVELPHT